MKISELNVRITIQKSVTQIDSIGNHSTQWEDYYECWANAKSTSTAQKETNEAAQILEQDKLDFTVRFCNKTSFLNSTEYRIIFQGELYNILHVDFLKYKKKSVKLLATLGRRS